MKTTWNKLKFLLAFILLGSISQLNAQDYPEVPSEIPFAGINVKFDNSAKSIILSDIKVLMINQKYWEEKLERALLYFPIVESIFIDEEVPIDFKYLAAQESSFIPDAVSTSDAVGFWQFKDASAMELGLRVDNQVDERKNISSSTRAAAAYLKRSHVHYNNWISALYSYYLGVQGVKNKLPANWRGASDVTLNGKADRYMLRFFAYKIAFEAGLERYRTKNPITLVEAPAAGGQRLDAIAEELKISYIDLKNYNRWLSGEVIPSDKPYFLTIPAASARVAAVKENLDIIEEPITAAATPIQEVSLTGYPKLRKATVQPQGNNPHVLYVINGIPGIQARAGDFTNSLARVAKLSAGKFRKYNDMDISMEVTPGEVYYTAQKNKKADTPYHTVREGETLQSIAQMYGIRLKNLMRYNRINSRNYRLEKGRQMWLNKRRPARTPVRIIEEDKTPVRTVTPTPTEAPIAKTTPVEEKPVHRVPTGNTDVPKTANDRVKYTPKLADAPASSPAPATPAPTKPAASTPVSEPAEKVLTRPANKSNSRVVIVTDDNIRPSSAATRPREEDSRPAYSPSTSATPTARPSTPANNNVYTSSKPAETVAKPTTPTATGTHVVEKGETYFSISKKYGLSITDLLNMNDRKISDNLQVGTKLKVAGTASKNNEPTATPSAKTAAPSTHTVQKGETLFSISKRYNVSIEAIKRANKLSDSGLQVGQKIKIPTN